MKNTKQFNMDVAADLLLAIDEVNQFYVTEKYRLIADYDEDADELLGISLGIYDDNDYQLTTLESDADLLLWLTRIRFECCTLHLSTLMSR